MENQHRKISGYRDFTEAEVALINKVKSVEVLVLDVHRQIVAYLEGQASTAKAIGDEVELRRIAAAEPNRWAQISKTHVQEGFMALNRAVAQPAPSSMFGKEST